MDLFGESYKGQRRGEHSQRLEGNGRFVFKNGDVFVGSFVDGQFHGKGVLIFSGGGGRFEGEWKNGVALRVEFDCWCFVVPISFIHTFKNKQTGRICF